MTESDTIPILGVRQPFAYLIACGIKTAEIRHHHTNIRGPIAIYATLTRPRKDDIQYVNDILAAYGYTLLPDKFDHGKIIARGSLDECNELNRGLFHETERLHFAPERFYLAGSTYAWMISGMEAIVPVEHKFIGCVVWDRIREALLNGESQEEGPDPDDEFKPLLGNYYSTRCDYDGSKIGNME